MTPDFIEVFVTVLLWSWIPMNICITLYSMWKDQAKWIQMMATPLGIVGFLVIIVASLWIAAPALIGGLIWRGIRKLRGKEDSK